MSRTKFLSTCALAAAAYFAGHRDGHTKGLLSGYGRAFRAVSCVKGA